MRAVLVATLAFVLVACYYYSVTSSNCVVLGVTSETTSLASLVDAAVEGALACEASKEGPDARRDVFTSAAMVLGSTGGTATAWMKSCTWLYSFIDFVGLPSTYPDEKLFADARRLLIAALAWTFAGVIICAVLYAPPKRQPRGATPELFGVWPHVWSVLGAPAEWLYYFWYRGVWGATDFDEIHEEYSSQFVATALLSSSSVTTAVAPVTPTKTSTSGSSGASSESGPTERPQRRAKSAASVALSLAAGSSSSFSSSSSSTVSSTSSSMFVQRIVKPLSPVATFHSDGRRNAEVHIRRLAASPEAASRPGLSESLLESLTVVRELRNLSALDEAGTRALKRVIICLTAFLIAKFVDSEATSISTSTFATVVAVTAAWLIVQLGVLPFELLHTLAVGAGLVAGAVGWSCSSNVGWQVADLGTVLVVLYVSIGVTNNLGEGTTERVASVRDGPLLTASFGSGLLLAGGYNWVSHQSVSAVEGGSAWLFTALVWVSGVAFLVREAGLWGWRSYTLIDPSWTRSFLNVINFASSWTAVVLLVVLPGNGLTFHWAMASLLGCFVETLARYIYWESGAGGRTTLSPAPSLTLALFSFLWLLNGTKVAGALHTTTLNLIGYYY